MITFSGRVGTIATCFSATNQVVPDLAKPVCVGFKNFKFIDKKFKDAPQWNPTKHKPVYSSYSAQKLVSRNPIAITNSISSSVQIRHAHTDVSQAPDFSYYRKESQGNPFKNTPENKANFDSRRMFDYVLFTAGLGATASVGKEFVHGFVRNMWIAPDTAAKGAIEVDIGNIPEGKSASFKWRGKPLFVRHRTPQEIEEARAVDLGALRDPQHDDDRVQKPEWLIVIGVCTHLGCVPFPYKGDYNGYYCPCHGSHYDTSGRLRSGPAPENLEVPEYKFLSETRVHVGGGE